MRPKQKHIAFLLFVSAIFFQFSIEAQNSYYNFKHLNVQTGLAQNIVYHFLQDTRGYMWLGTRNGLTLYDGSRSISYLNDETVQTSIANNFITRIIEDPLQQIWIGTDAGISRYNRNDNSFSNFNLQMRDGRKEAAFCVLLGFISTHELLLIETKTKSIRIFNTQTQITDSLAATSAVDGVLRYDSLSHTNHIWTYLSSGTIHYIFKNKKLFKEEKFFSAENKKDKEPVFQVVHVLPQNDSLVWLSTTEGLVELNPQNGRFSVHASWGTKNINELRYTALAPNGTLWVATGNNGIYTFDIKTKQFVDNFKNYGLDPFSVCSNNIVSLYFDKVGNIWCGSYGQGVSYAAVENAFFQKLLPRHQFSQGEDNNVAWLGADNAANIWCILNNSSGLWKLNKDRQITEHIEPLLENGKKFSSNFYKLLFDGNNHAWCIGKEGLFRYDIIANHLQKINYPLLSNELFGSNWVRDIIQLKDGSFLFSTFGGLYRITSKKGAYDIQPFSELNKKASVSFHSLYQDENGTIYVKDVGNQLYILEKKKSASGESEIHSIQFLGEINQFYTDTANNCILLATNFGLYQLNRPGNTLKKINLPTPFLSINGLIKKDEQLWLFGEKGLYCFNQNKGSCRTFTTEDGLPSNEFNPSAIAYTSGECIAGTTNGLVSFFPGKLHDRIYPPVVQITNIFVNDVLTPYVPNPQEASAIHLSHNQNTFSFEFAPIAFQNAAGCSFEYKLQGYDADWIRSGNARYTRYSQIPPGNYVFQLRAIDANGVISPYSKTLQIEIRKAFWQTTLFKVAVFALLLAGIWLIIKEYLNKKLRKHKREFEKQQAVEKERTRIASDMHDDLGAGLSTLRFLSEKVKRNSFSEVTKNDADKIATNSDELVQKMNEIIWAMNEKNDTLEDLLFYTRNYAVEYCEENNLTWQIQLPETIPEIFVSGEMRRNVFLTVKESLHNVVKHAAANKIFLQFSIDKNLTVSIKDDGVGFLHNQHNEGNGLQNMKKRIESIGGNFNVLHSEGVAVEMKVPLKYR